jgi:phosphoribosylglycinamide formyltransferase-1
MADFHLISEAVRPVPESLAAPGAPGEPGLPMRFVWRGREYAVAAVLARWRETGPCRHGSGERYLRKHWFHVRTADGAEMKLYFERSARSGKVRRSWRLYTATIAPE